MFVYQAIIMFLVIFIVFVLAFVIKLRNRSILFVLIVALVLIGSFTLSLIQDYFGVQYYTQKIDTSYYSKLKLTQTQKSRLGSILKGFTNTTASQEQCRAAYEKNEKLQIGKLSSSIRVDVMLYKTEPDAYEYLRVRQRFYDNKVVLPSDPVKTEKSNKDADFRYITSYIRSSYENVNDLIYVPSRIYYISEVIIQDGDMIIDLSERTNKPDTAKNQVLAELAKDFTAAR